MPQRIVRLFVSSTFSDFVAERNALHERVWPRLQQLCRGRGGTFQVIDLRWGVSDEAGTDQRTMTICLQELARCQQVSPRPNCLVLLGDRYGWQPLPPAIAAGEFEQLLGLLAVGERQRLGDWYRRDDNAVPAVYVLRPRRGEYRDDNDRWAREEAALLALLRTALGRAVWSATDPRRHKYEDSATHQEIRAGVLDVPDAAEHVFCYARRLDGLPGSAAAKGFLDLRPDGTPDTEARDRLERLHQQVAGRLGDHYRRFTTPWTARGPAPAHLDALCRQVEADLRGFLDQELCRADDRTEHQREAGFHRETARRYSAGFVGRARPLARLRQSLATPARLTIVHGPPGSGKTALLGRFAQLAAEQRPAPFVGVWFLGKTPATSRLGPLLAELCLELGPAGGKQPAGGAEDRASLPLEQHALVEEFHRRLAAAAGRGPVVLVLDALDQLADAEADLSWLPAPLPAGARVVASTTGEGPPNLGRWPEAVALSLEALDPDEVALLLDAWLRDAGRALQPAQRQQVLAACRACPWPLYLRLAFEAARGWYSFDPPTPLGADAGALIEQLFHRLAEPAQHGPRLVERCLGYLAAARHGLGEDELLDVLASDKDFFEDFRGHAHHTLPGDAERLPHVVWARLFYDLQPYLSEHASDGVVTLAYYHRQIAEVARRSYLSDPATARARHRCLAGVLWKAADPAGDRSWSGPAPRAFRELAFHGAGAAPDDAPAADLYHLAGSPRFRRAQFAALHDLDPVLECLRLALGHAVARRDARHTFRFVLERGYLFPVLVQTFLPRLPQLAEENPELARTVTGLLPGAGSRLLARSLLVWHGLRHPPSRPAARRLLDEIGQTAPEDVPVHAGPWLLELARDLHGEEIDMRPLLCLVADGPLRRIVREGWRHGPAPVQALAAELSRPAARAWSAEETAHWQALQDVAWGRWLKGTAAQDVPGFEREVIDHFGREGMEAVWTVLAAQRLSHGAREEAAVLLAHALFFPASRWPDALRTWYALAQHLGAVGETILAQEFRGKLSVLVANRDRSTADAAARRFLVQLAEQGAPDVRAAPSVSGTPASVLDREPEEVAGVARALRNAGRVWELYGLLKEACRRGAAFGVLDALLAELAASDDLGAAVLADLSDEVRRQDWQFPVPSPLGLYYFDFPWIYLVGTGLALGCLAGLSGPIREVAGIGVVGGLLDLLVWRALGVFRRPERSRLPAAFLGSLAASVGGSLLVLGSPRPLAPLASQVTLGVAAVVIALGWWGAQQAGVVWTHFRPRRWLTFVLGTGLACGAAALTAPALAALGDEVRSPVGLAGALALGLGLNVLVKWAPIRRLFRRAEPWEERLQPAPPPRSELATVLAEWPVEARALRVAFEAWSSRRWRDAAVAYDLVLASPRFERLPAYHQAVTHLNHAMALEGVGARDRAEQSARRAAGLNPHSGAAAHTLALFLARDRGRFGDALPEVNDAIGRTPTDPEFYSTRGLIRQRLGDPAGAETDFRTALELWPGFVDGLTNYAILCEQQGRRVEAGSLYRRAHEARPDDLEARRAWETWQRTQ
jgi:tetratricopeptide (TPR) repeat protein